MKCHEKLPYSGRINRRINLLLHLRREEERRRKLYRFSPWQRLTFQICNCKPMVSREIWDRFPEMG